MALTRTSRRRARSSSLLLEPNFTPLLDVVLQLIVFLLMLVQFGSQIEQMPQHHPALPITPTRLPAGALGKDVLTVGLDHNGRLLIPDQPDGLGPNEAERWWADQATLRNNKSDPVAAEGLATEVILRADANARYASVRQALALAEAHGFRLFSLVVLRGTPP